MSTRTPSKRRDRLEAAPSGNMASPLQGPARWKTIADGMHASNASAIDARTERANNQRADRRAKRGA